MADCRLWWGIIALTATATAGCGPRAVSGAHGQPADQARTDGHVYLAQLATRHPLYPDLARIDEAIGALRAPHETAELTMLAPPLSLTGRYAVGPVAVELRETALGVRRERAVSRIAAALPLEAPGSLPPDLEARLEWSRAQAERTAARQLLEAHSEAGQELAAETARLYRENQERLNDLGERIAGAPPARQAVIEELEADIARLRREHQNRLARLEEQLAVQTHARKTAAQRAAWEEARRRLAPPADPLAGEPAAFMSRKIRAAEFPPWPAQVRVEFPQPDLPAPDAARRPSAEALGGRQQQARERQVQALVRGRADMTSRILAATRLAAEKTARSRGIRLHYPPADHPVGPDVSAEIGEALGRLWATDTP